MSIFLIISNYFFVKYQFPGWLLPLQVDGAVPSALQCVSDDHATVASCAPRGPYAEQPVGPAASCEPPSALCSPAADAGSPASGWTHQEHWGLNWWPEMKIWRRGFWGQSFVWRTRVKDSYYSDRDDKLQLPWLSVISTIFILFITTTVLILCLFYKKKKWINKSQTLHEKTLWHINLQNTSVDHSPWRDNIAWIPPIRLLPSFAYLSLLFSCAYGQYGLWAEFGPGAQWADPWWRSAWAAALWMVGWDMSSRDNPL